MPYDTLPSRYRDLIPARNGQDIFRNVLNSQLAAGKSEEVAFASAWAALQRAGYAESPDGKWVEKTQPGADAVHTPGTDWETEKAEDGTYKPPQAARNNARRVLAWKKKYGSDVKGMTSVGWARARQLASGKPISRDTVARMSAFNRHRKNAAVAPEHKNEPWKDAGHVAWLGWGGTTGVDWARRTMRGVAKRMLNDDTFTTREEAMARSYDLGLEGVIHVHQTADGQATYMPGENHEAYLEQTAMRAGLEEYEDDEIETETEDDEAESDDLLERVISAILQAVTKGDDMEQTFVKTADVIKVDGERRIAWGWASVSTLKGETVIDRQGDVISPVEMEKMADSFMASARTAKAMHDGEGVGEVLHSLPLTKALADALGIQTDREGWIIGMKIHDDKTWGMFKSGALAAFSIGGKAKRKVVR